MTVSALALFTFCTASVAGQGVVAASPAPVATAEQCSDETYRWGGDVGLGGTSATSYDTGIAVPASSGTTVTVVGVSADGLDAAGFAQALSVHVGGMRAANGAAIAGGPIVVSTASSDVSGSVRVVGVTVVVRRCAVVASAAPTDSLRLSSAEPLSFTLPATGRNEWRQTLIGAVVLALGLALVSFGRSRPESS